VRLFNEIGACLASARLCADLREDVVQLPTGAWYDPAMDDQGRSMCVHGNPNVLTRDVGTSSLAQGCAGQLSTVQIERYDGALPPIRAFEQPVQHR
jgi:biotin/methionine sulfoxide reductase